MKIQMNIKNIKINNFRNLDGVKVAFHKRTNFIVGENNLGKTNLLELLHIIFNRRSFLESDFNDNQIAIEIEVEIQLQDEEIGIFDDYFNVDEYPDSITIVFKQETVDDDIIYYEKNTGDKIFRNQIRNAHFISYGSIRRPDQELSFSSPRKNFLSLIVEKINEDKDETTYLNTEAMALLVKSINEYVTKIETFNLFGIKAKVDHDVTGLLGRIIQLQTENEFDIHELGEGTQFLNSIPLILLNQIYNIKDRGYIDSVIEVEGRKILNVIISIDEPELHLHPHSQRFFIDYLNEILTGNNERFNSLLKQIFNIDGIRGQLLVVTHSPFVLLNEHKYISRIYKYEGKILVKSGINIEIPENKTGHFYRFFDKLKEAFFARKVLVLEGETELGAINTFFNKEGTKISVQGISVVDVRGVGSVPHVMELFGKFGIPTYGYIDRDDNNLEEKINLKKQNIFLTELREFEDEVIEHLDLDSYIKYLEKRQLNIVSHTAVIVERFYEDINKTCAQEYKEALESLDNDMKEKIYTSLKERIRNHLIRNKGIVTGSILAEVLPKMPSSLKKVVKLMVNDNG